MTDFLPKDLIAALHAGATGRARRRNRLAVEADGRRHTVLRIWANGFAVEKDTPRLRGLVDLDDSARHLKRCLIVAASEEDGEMRYEFKRMSEGLGEQPLDYARRTDAPSGYLEYDG